MKIIGITGGVGAGKSEILKRVSAMPRVKVVYCDPLARELEAPGGPLFPALQALLGEDITLSGGELDRAKIASRLFSSPALQEKVNHLVHPAVKAAFREIAAKEKETGETDFLFLEGALLLEAGFREECDEIWYVYTSPEIRRERLKQSRGYSEEKITSIMEKQLPESEFRKSCDYVIDNSMSVEYSMQQVFQKLERM